MLAKLVENLLSGMPEKVIHKVICLLRHSATKPSKVKGMPTKTFRVKKYRGQVLACGYCWLMCRAGAGHGRSRKCCRTLVLKDPGMLEEPAETANQNWKQNLNFLQ